MRAARRLRRPQPRPRRARSRRPSRCPPASAPPARRGRGASPRRPAPRERARPVRDAQIAQGGGQFAGHLRCSMPSGDGCRPGRDRTEARRAQGKRDAPIAPPTWADSHVGRLCADQRGAGAPGGSDHAGRFPPLSAESRPTWDGAHADCPDHARRLARLSAVSRPTWNGRPTGGEDEGEVRAQQRHQARPSIRSSFGPAGSAGSAAARAREDQAARSSAPGAARTGVTQTGCRRVATGCRSATLRP